MFAVLEHHQSPAGSQAEAHASDVHWDLLVEVAGQERLATWRLSENPIEVDAPIPALRIEDHRRIYLDYEGPLTGRRGWVRRVDSGAAKLESLPGGAEDAGAAAPVILALEGRRLRGSFAIRQCGAGLCFVRVAHG
jgi:hypothetical protein